MKKVFVVYATVADGIVGINGHERLRLTEVRFDETVSPRMAETWAKDLVGKTLEVPQLFAAAPTKGFGLVLSSRAVEETRDENEQLTFEGTVPAAIPLAGLEEND